MEVKIYIDFSEDLTVMSLLEVSKKIDNVFSKGLKLWIAWTLKLIKSSEKLRYLHYRRKRNSSFGKKLFLCFNKFLYICIVFSDTR